MQDTSQDPTKRKGITLAAFEEREMARPDAIVTRHDGYIEISYHSAPVRSVNRQHQGRAPRRATNSRSTGSRRAGSSSSSSSADPGDSDGESDEPPPRGPAPRPRFSRPWRRADGQLAARLAAIRGTVR